MDKAASTKSGKAKILVFASSIIIIGLALVCAGNLLRIFEVDVSESVTNFTQIKVPATPAPVRGIDSVPYYAIIVMIGYACVDCGFDATNCFLKTFALACTPASDHSSIIVKNVLISTIGGCLISVLSAVGAGRLLTSGENFDPSSVQAALCAAVCFVLVVGGLVITLVTGLCCSPGQEELEQKDGKYHLIDNECEDELIKRNLYLSRTRSRSFTVSQQVERELCDPNSRPRGTTFAEELDAARKNGCYELPTQTAKSGRPRGNTVSDPPPTPVPLRRNTMCVPNHSCDTIPEECLQRRLNSDPMMVVPPKDGVLALMRRYHRQIILNISTFFIMGSMYSFMVYVPNFVGIAIYSGDPKAELNSEEYGRYIRGIEFGGAGTLVFYGAFILTIVALHKAITMKSLRWYMLMSSLVMAILSLGLAISESLIVFIMASAWAGAYRAVASTVPYILANQFAIEQVGAKSSGVSISIVATMLPLGFTLTSALMGPLIHATGNSGAPLFYCSVTSFLGCFTFTFLNV